MEPGGLWDADKLEIKGLIRKDGKPFGGFDLAYAGAPSQFEATVVVEETGVYEVTVYAYDASNGNTGLDRTTFIVQEAGQ